MIWNEKLPNALIMSPLGEKKCYKIGNHFSKNFKVQIFKEKKKIILK